MGAREQEFGKLKKVIDKKQDDDGTKKVILMEQVDSSKHVFEGPDSDVEVGDRVGNFEVTQIDMVECDHPSVSWRLDQKASGNSLPEVTGICSVCGATIPVDVGYSDTEEGE